MILSKYQCILNLFLLYIFIPVSVTRPFLMIVSALTVFMCKAVN